jgi:hypothetical protein
VGRRRRKRPGFALLSALDRISGFPCPRQQFIETVDRISGDHALEHLLQICIGFDAVELAGFAARKEMILPSESNRPNRALDGVGVQIDAAVVQEAGQTMPARQRVPDRSGECAAGD